MKNSVGKNKKINSEKNLLFQIDTLTPFSNVTPETIFFFRWAKFVGILGSNARGVATELLLVLFFWPPRRCRVRRACSFLLWLCASFCLQNRRYLWSRRAPFFYGSQKEEGFFVCFSLRVRNSFCTGIRAKWHKLYLLKLERRRRRCPFNGAYK